MAKEQQPKKTAEQQMTGAEMRKAAHEARMLTEVNIEDSREEFRKYFVELRRKLNLASEIENVIWLHLCAINMNVKEKFADGVKHFGYNI